MALNAVLARGLKEQIVKAANADPFRDLAFWALGSRITEEELLGVLLGPDCVQLPNEITNAIHTKFRDVEREYGKKLFPEKYKL